MSRKSKRAKRLRVVLCVLAVVVCLCVALAHRWEEIYRAAGLTNEATAGELSVYVLDAGNADCTVVTLGEETLLIDAGLPSFSDDLCDFLERKHIEDLDYVIATHMHNDHIGGMAEVIETVPVEEFLISPFPGGKAPSTSAYRRLMAALSEQDLTPTVVTAGEKFFFGSATIEVLSPSDTSGDTNNQSVVCRLIYGEDRFIFMGDAEEPVEETLLSKNASLRADFLKVGHHGSRTATTRAFLEAVMPQVAVIPCKEGNSYGHPHSEVLRLLHEKKISVYRSDLHGNITVISNGNGLSVLPEREAAS